MTVRRTESGLAWAVLMVVTGGSLPASSHWFGWLGDSLSLGLHTSFGDAAWLIPVWCGDVSRRTFAGYDRSTMRAIRWMLLCILSAVSLSLLGAVGGWIGVSLSSILVQSIGAGAALLVMGTWLVLVLRLLGPERVQGIAVRATSISRQALAQYRPLAVRTALPAGTAVIDTVGEPVSLPSSLPGPPPIPSTLIPVKPAAEDSEVRSMTFTAAKPALSKAPSNWDLPNVQRLLQKPKHNRVDRDFLAAVAVDLENRLRHFRRAATVQPAEKQGALVSRYEITLAAGQEIAPIQAREEDLEAAYKGLRFASLSGTGKLGIEIPLPEPQRRPIMLREVLDSPAWTSSNAVFPIAIGVTSSNEPVVVDLASSKTPHMLVAGTTGSGKSVGINAMLTSLLVRYSPSELKLLIFDPKVVEFVIFHGLPHLLKPVITEMEEAIEQLQWACKEMDERYVTMARVKAKNLESYNDSVCEEKRLPRIVIVIDEFADLMLVRVKNPNKPTELLNLKNSNELVTGLVMRLAQKARAAGIHVILATQRPSVDVVSGPVKANFAVRIAYKVLQREDSKTIVGTGGAELLLGNGDALCSIPSLSTDLVRVHGSFVSEEEVAAVVASWLSQATGEEQRARSPRPALVPENPSETEAPRLPAPQPAPAGLSLLQQQNKVVAAPTPIDAEALFTRAVELARSRGYVSARQLEEELGIGTKKSKKLFARLRDAGLIRPGGRNNAHVYIGPNTPEHAPHSSTSQA